MAAKKTTRKTAAAKKPASKKARTKKTAGKKATRRRAPTDLVGDELPKSLKALGRQLRRDLSSVEKQIEVCGADTRRSLTRIVRDASHQLGALEARGEREFRSLSRTAVKELELLMKRLRKATTG